MAQRTYVQGYVQRVLDLAKYANKHAAKLSAAGLPGGVTAVGDAAKAAVPAAQPLLNVDER